MKTLITLFLFILIACSPKHKKQDTEYANVYVNAGEQSNTVHSLDFTEVAINQTGATTGKVLSLNAKVIPMTGTHTMYGLVFNPIIDRDCKDTSKWISRFEFKNGRMIPVMESPLGHCKYYFIAYSNISNP